MEPEQTQITLNDFAITVSIIDTCSQRGAFKGDELTAVGQLRDKFAAFIKANTASADVAESQPEAAEEAATEASE